MGFLRLLELLAWLSVRPFLPVVAALAGAYVVLELCSLAWRPHRMPAPATTPAPAVEAELPANVIPFRPKGRIA